MILITGYARENTRHLKIKLMLLIPEEVVNAIFSYYHTQLLEWHTDIFGQLAYRIIVEKTNKDNKLYQARNNTVEYIGSKNTYSIIAKKMYTVSSTVCGKFYCELTLINLPKSDSWMYTMHQYNFDGCFGYIDAEKGNLNDLNHTLGWGSKYEYGIRININNDYNSKTGISSVKLYNNGDKPNNQLSLKWAKMINGQQLNIGDRFAFEIDFDRRTTSIYYNDSIIDVVFRNVPNKIIPAVTLFQNNTAISCTKYEFYSKIDVCNDFQDYWACTFCTYYNKNMNASQCKVCLSKRQMHDQ